MQLSKEPFVIILFFFFFFLRFLVGPLCCVCLFVCLFAFFFFFCSPVLKGDESILCFSVWEKFQQQTFCSPPLFTGAKRSSAIFAAGETRRGEARRGKWKRSLARSLDVWLLVEMGKM